MQQQEIPPNLIGLLNKSKIPWYVATVNSWEEVEQLMKTVAQGEDPLNVFVVFNPFINVKEETTHEVNLKIQTK